ncbi:MAG: response regulator [Planctomycetes bacterium]|nr:response regulator [Planctomycetota bacterium]
MTDRARILVVEDEERQRDTLVRHLTRDGFEVVDFGAAEPAIEELGKQSFDGLVTDLRLPGADGIELVRRARELDEELTAIVMTAYASVDTAVDALRAGASDYVLKPLFFEELSRKLRRGIEPSR